jgi:hypothetical protein
VSIHVSLIRDVHGNDTDVNKFLSFPATPFSQNQVFWQCQSDVCFESTAGYGRESKVSSKAHDLAKLYSGKKEVERLTYPCV